MIQVLIKKQEVITNRATFETQEEVDSWVTHGGANYWFGKPERWLSEQNFTDETIEDSLDSREVEGMLETVTEYKFAAEYTVEQEDITAQVAQEQLNRESLAYLASTDWYVVRFIETNVPVPEEVLTARAAARTAIVR